jgi:hypothetical protein
MSVVKSIKNYFASAQSGMVLTSVEPEECFEELCEAVRLAADTEEPIDLYFWDVADGLTDHTGTSIVLGQGDTSDADLASLGISGGQVQKMGIHDTLEQVLMTARDRNYRAEIGEATAEDQSIRCLVIRNFDRFLCPTGQSSQVDPVVMTYVQKIIKDGQGSNTFVIMQTTPGFELPDELVAHCEFVNHELPSSDERRKILTDDLDVEESHVTDAVLSATAGLSRAKTTQYAAESLAAYSDLNPLAIFDKKAKHLSRSSKLDVWSPEFVSQIRLWPDASVESMRDATDVMMLEEETRVQNPDLNVGEVRARVRYLTNGEHVEKWLDPMDRELFDSTYRPERDFYSLKSVVGLQGLKTFLRNGFRPDVPDRARMKHVLMLGVPGTGKSFMMQCCSGEFRTPLSSMQASNLYSKWLGDTDKILARMLSTVEMIGGILAIDEFQRFLPQGGSGGESGGVENRLLGTLLTWFNNQQSNLVLSAANNISNLPDEITRSGRVDALMFVGFPGRAAKDAAWQMYLKRHELAEQSLPSDDHWTPADIMSCCRLAELQQCSVKEASRWITPSYEKNQKQMDELMDWAEGAGCICAETGERFVHPRKNRKSSTSKVTRKVRQRSTTSE